MVTLTIKNTHIFFLDKNQKQCYFFHMNFVPTKAETEILARICRTKKTYKKAPSQVFLEKTSFRIDFIIPLTAYDKKLKTADHSGNFNSFRKIFQCH